MALAAPPPHPKRETLLIYKISAEIYDAMYPNKDYRAEAESVAALIGARRPGSKTLLDVGCGTGRHLEHLAGVFDVQGLDISPGLLAAARERCPATEFHQASMLDFDLGQQFDVVTVLFSAIAAAVTEVASLEFVVANLARHVVPGGLVMVEPFFTPDNYWEGHLTAHFVEKPDLKIAWMYVQQRVGTAAVLDIHFQVGRPGGIEQFRERYENGLFTDEQYRAAFEKAGLSVDYRPETIEKGLYVGQTPA